MAGTPSAQKRSIDEPDEVRLPPKGRIEMVSVGDVLFARTTFQPGWKWSESVKPIAQTDSCQFHHAGYVESGALHLEMDDGTELDVTAGDIVVIEPGHDAWVVGDTPCVMYDFGTQDADFAKPSA